LAGDEAHVDAPVGRYSYPPTGQRIEPELIHSVISAGRLIGFHGSARVCAAPRIV
jgi:hypothetical protein